MCLLILLEYSCKRFFVQAFVESINCSFTVTVCAPARTTYVITPTGHAAPTLHVITVWAPAGHAAPALAHSSHRSWRPTNSQRLCQLQLALQNRRVWTGAHRGTGFTAALPGGEWFLPPCSRGAYIFRNVYPSRVTCSSCSDM
jgi:hypothetical protein